MAGLLAVAPAPPARGDVILHYQGVPYDSITDETPPAGATYDTSMSLSLLLRFNAADAPRSWGYGEVTSLLQYYAVPPDHPIALRDHLVEDGAHSLTSADSEFSYLEVFRGIDQEELSGWIFFVTSGALAEVGSQARVASSFAPIVGGVPSFLGEEASLRECVASDAGSCEAWQEDAGGPSAAGTWRLWMQCNDGEDNDGDGAIDDADAGCGSPEDTSEWDVPLSAGDHRLLAPSESGASFPGGGFGSALAGAFSQEGAALAVGSPLDDPSATSGWDGFVSAAGGLAWHAAAYGRSVEAGDAFGAALVSGDFDGDFIDELAVGLPLSSASGGAPLEAGAVVVRPLLDAGAEVLWHLDVTGVPGTATVGDHFGEVLATGDFDGDGFDDLAVGIPDYDFGLDGGAVLLLHGSGSGLSAAGSMLWYQSLFGRADDPGDRFGAALAVGDFDCDRVDDLAIGAPGADNASTDDGLVFVLRGGSTLAAAGTWHQDVAGVEGGAELGDAFGAALAAGDFDGDGCDDLAVGVPGEDIGATVDSGMVNVLYGSSSGITASGDVTRGQAGLETQEPGDRFGSVLLAGDVDGDLIDDLLIGVPEEDLGGAVDAGVVHVVFGSASGLLPVGDASSQLWSQDVAGLPTTSESGDAFGSALALGHWDGDFLQDLAIGIPHEQGEGAVLVLFDGVPDCANGTDDDGDGLVDFGGDVMVDGDPGCTGPGDGSEHEASRPCDDGLDNDGDGWVDYRGSGGDPACRDLLWTRENAQCQDGLDNDGQAGIDFDGGQSIHGACTAGPGGCPPGVWDPDDDGVANPDPQCGLPWRNRERSGCGVGFELVLLVPWILRRRGGRARG